MSEHKKVEISKADAEKYGAHTGMPFGIDDKINHMDLNNNGVSDVVELGKASEYLVPPIMKFANNGGIDALEKTIAPNCSPVAREALSELKSAIEKIKAESGK